MTDETMQEPEREEQRLAGLIREGGARAQPPAAVRAAVRAAALAEWRAVTEQAAARARRRSATRWSLAAAASIAGIAAWLALPLLQPPSVTAATLSRVSGPVEHGAAGFAGRFVAAHAGGAVLVGEEIRSGRAGRAALQIGGVSLRLDEQSVVAMLAPGRVALKRGAIYVDAESAAATSLVVETAFGTVEHVGTQYETRVTASDLRVRVREGRVRLGNEERTVEGTAGEQVTLARDGEVRREPVARAGGEWAWVGEIVPAFDIENRPLAEFLRWLSRETGREVAYGSSASEALAAGMLLRGSVSGLTPERALAAVLSTTQLGYITTPDRLVIDFRTGDGT